MLGNGTFVTSYSFNIPHNQDLILLDRALLPIKLLRI